jgi:tetratricopeptide (TPR) repeat protein
MGGSMTIEPGRLVVGLLVALLTVFSAPGWAQSDEWYDVSKAGLRAADEGRFGDAEGLFRDALLLSDRYEESDPRRATSVNNLAYVLHAQGHYPAAEPHYRESLAMRERALGPDHPDVAPSCNNLA